jgi:hypothetical protein
MRWQVVNEQDMQHMQLPRGIWDRVNWWSVLTTVVLVTFWAGVQWRDNTGKFEDTNQKIDALSNQIAKVEAQGKEQVIAAEGNFKVINSQIGDIPYRMALNEKAIDEVNKRLDRLIEGFTDKIDRVLDNQGKTDTKVEVVSSQVDDLKKSIANKIVWRETSIVPVPILREVSLKPCYLPTRSGYTAVKSYYRRTASLP